MGYYAEYDTIKKKMRIPDDSLKDELQILSKSEKKNHI